MGELAKIVVCIIDDDPSIQEIYRMKFIQEGFSVISASLALARPPFASKS